MHTLIGINHDSNRILRTCYKLYDLYPEVRYSCTPSDFRSTSQSIAHSMHRLMNSADFVLLRIQVTPYMPFHNKDNMVLPIEKHQMSSPIWDCTVQAIEVFFPKDEGETEWMPAHIERISPLEVWYSDPDPDIRSTEDFVKLYTTKNIRDMIGNDQHASQAQRRSTRGPKSYHGQRLGMVW
jgi:hypothetical protein